MKHSVMIPDWVWEYWQDITGGPKPAGRIREELIKITLEHKVKTEIKHRIELSSSTNISVLPEPLNYDDAVDFDVDDSPTAITIERIGVCKYCERLMQKGEEAFWFSDSGRKHLAHPECWSDNRENSRNTT